ncbi:hypothetical protein MHB77_31430 [Paenibacillus sp. FSL K6-3166]|uniref:hypothetical protein n=1 Tax=unclassified Paenibacillus TaxID=185978 RepID=UPI001D9775AD|nr:hypothetical protein [Acinetobacter sp. CUI P1]
MKRRKGIRKMSLTEALDIQQRGPITKFCSCTEPVVDIKPTQLILHGITVPNMPTPMCASCGEHIHNASIMIAVEDLQEEHQLQGAYRLEQLLNIEKN